MNSNSKCVNSQKAPTPLSHTTLFLLLKHAKGPVAAEGSKQRAKSALSLTRREVLIKLSVQSDVTGFLRDDTTLIEQLMEPTEPRPPGLSIN